MNLLAQNFAEIEKAAGIPTVSVGGVGPIVTKILPYVFGAAGIILVLNVISSGLKIMTSVGDPKNLQGAQSKLTTSLIGILILFTSFWIVQLILKFLGINISLIT